MRQTSTIRRGLIASAFLIVAGLVMLGAVAYACVPLATLHANPISAAPGSTVTLFGKYYSGGGSSAAAGAGPIEIHLDSRTGPVIATFPPGLTTISGTWVIPADMASGEYTLIATQYTPAGNPVSGTPGRATVVVTRTSGRSGDSPAGAATATSNDPAAASSEPAASAAPAGPAAPAAQAAPRSEAVPAAAGQPAGGGAAAPPARTDAGPVPVADPGAVPGTVDAVRSPQGAAAASASPELQAPAAAAGSSSPAVDAAALDVGLLQPSSSSSSSGALPMATVAVGLALVLLGLGAVLKSGRSMFGDRRVNPVAA